MAQYVATFFSHYDAITFAQNLAAKGIAAKPMPVPRRVSSSCGTGVRFETNRDVAPLLQEGLDKVYRCDADAYVLVLENPQN